MVFLSPNLFGPGIIALSITLTFGFLFLIIINAQRHLDIEKDKTPIYTSTTGGEIGGLTYKGPFISLRIYEDFLVIRYTKTLVFRFDEIDRVEVKKWMGKTPHRIQLFHHKLDAPSKIMIGTMNPAKVKELIDSKLLPEL